MPTITTSIIDSDTDIDTTANECVPLPCAVQQPIPPPVLVPLQPTPEIPPPPITLTTPLLFSSQDILQIQPPNCSLLRCLVSAAHQSTPMAGSFPGSLLSLAVTPCSYMVTLRFLRIVSHILWFDALSTIQKHEFEPPPSTVIGFNFDPSLEGKAVWRVRQLIRCRHGACTHVAADADGAQHQTWQIREIVGLMMDEGGNMGS